MTIGTAIFAYSDALKAIGIDDEAGLGRLIETAYPSATLVRSVLDYPNQPQSRVAGRLYAWPSPDAGLMIYARTAETGDTERVVLAWPFATATATDHDCLIDDIHHDPDVEEIRMYEGVIGEMRLTLFDTVCEGCFSLIGVDEILGARIHGWAVTAGRSVGPAIGSAGEPLSSPGGVSSSPGQGVVGARAPGRPSPLYPFHSRIRAVRPRDLFPHMAAWTVVITLPRAGDGGADVDIDLTVTAALWKGPPPRVGEVIFGTLWLQATFEWDDD